MRENGREKYAGMSQKRHDRVLESAMSVMLTNAGFILLFYDLNAVRRQNFKYKTSSRMRT
ncbi:hypothetical protein ALC53_06415 [Atta colombica]|uniref:Uncharacterized protein n=1 Tax=Atta colombica TaxID=520822 RepID=A0A195BEZ5_9HYME|nr:hypothetical protein ALC53_06415 [Atta colombica]